MNDQSIDLSGMAREIADRLKETQPGPDVTFNIQKNLHARGDEKLLRIAFENLLANAWKYTRNRNKAVIEFGTVFRAGEQTYCVRDNGAGFDIRYAHKLFTTFQRLDSHREFEGTGIGLATAQRVVGRHRGRIWSEAKVGEGASFYFQLPTAGGGERSEGGGLGRGGEPTGWLSKGHVEKVEGEYRHQYERDRYSQPVNRAPGPDNGLRLRQEPGAWLSAAVRCREAAEVACIANKLEHLVNQWSTLDAVAQTQTSTITQAGTHRV